jgi:MarR family transcriptional regulator, lower aerobic nicotinate degradation pathway regulator
MARRSPPPADHVAQEVAIRGVRSVVATLSRSARAIETRTGVSNAQLFLLQQLEPGMALTINELAARARTGQSAVSIIVSRLVRRGLVERQRSAPDRRRVAVSLTPAGRALARQAPESSTARLLAAVGALPAADLRALARGVTTLARALGADTEAPTLLFEREPEPSQPGTITRGAARAAARPTRRARGSG